MIVPADHTAGKHALRWCFYEDRQIGKKGNPDNRGGISFPEEEYNARREKKARRKAERMKKKAGLTEKH